MTNSVGMVRYQVLGAVAVVSLNRPERRNALGGTLREDIVRAMTLAGSDEKVRVIILTGEGNAFCAGGDLKEMSVGSAGRPLSEHIDPPRDRTALAILESPKPVIAAVNGAALGAGMSLALAADIRIAAAEATFAQTFVKRGNVPDYGATFLLPRIVGLSRALELIYTGRTIDAQEALRWQIVNAVEAADRLLPAAIELANTIAAHAPVALQLAKRVVYRNQGNVRDALEREAFAQNVCFESEDSREGLRAYFEKRAPAFLGR